MNTKPTTLKDARDQLATIGWRIRRTLDGEIQVKPNDAETWDDPNVYFTDDIDDAIATARAEAARTGRTA